MCKLCDSDIVVFFIYLLRMHSLNLMDLAYSCLAGGAGNRPDLTFA